ncbi:histidinol-phosphatase [Desulfobotulus sp. H1]|uniref:Histidinol-phosphatase n=1 Tax=Desulfobotulus pelophilus TaxID=2823377 RepID=A0ABT3NBV9_9BACT|nr:histidinol-phosphatase [Desulfobotulus pelophilus]MCW7754942.1 histidinol-phosphatase [Desulfobotulus pelophilus]
MLDYHVHTPLCKHATGTPAAMVRAAVAKGLQEVAFLDHLTLPPLPTDHSMTLKDIPFYLNTIRELTHAWEGRIRVLAGLEIDFHPDCLPTLRTVCNSFDLDIVGGSVHFVNGHNIASRSGIKTWAALPPLPLYHAYIDTMEALVDADLCDMLCHLDLMDKFAPLLSHEQRQEIDSRMNNLLSLVARKQTVVEVNGSGMDQPKGHPYPSPSLLAACHEKGIPVTLSSDAHNPFSVGRHNQALLGYIRQAGYKAITKFYGRKPHSMILTEGGQP